MDTHIANNIWGLNKMDQNQCQTMVDNIRARFPNAKETNLLMDGIQDLLDKHSLIGDIFTVNDGQILILDYHGFINGQDIYRVRYNRNWHIVEWEGLMALSKILEKMIW